MIQKNELIASLDIGSSKIKCLIAKLKNKLLHQISKMTMGINFSKVQNHSGPI